jgi:hypothetical protein
LDRTRRREASSEAGQQSGEDPQGCHAEDGADNRAPGRTERDTDANLAGALPYETGDNAVHAAGCHEQCEERESADQASLKPRLRNRIGEYFLHRQDIEDSLVRVDGTDGSLYV